jgi:FHA domain
VKCPVGHESSAVDYCDQCGVKMEGVTPGVLPPAVAPAPASGPTSVAVTPGASPAKAAGFDVATTAGTCPNCSAPKDGASIFCEDCGYDFVAGVVPVSRSAAGVSGQLASSPSTSPPTTPHHAGTWMIVVATDRAQFDRVGDATVVFPVGVPDRVVEITQDRALIGRRSTSRNIHPEIDLSPTPEDVAVSRQHAELLRAADGTFTVTDLGSSNGTFLNGSASAISPNTPMPLANGDSISVGAWTTLTLVLP